MGRVLVIYGTRPEAIKMAPIVGRLRGDATHEVVVAVTAQHREMLDQVNEVFGIRVDRDLDLMTPRQGLAPLTGAAINGLGEVVEDVDPDLVMVQGDTTTTMAGAFAAFLNGVPVLHVEAGLRTGDRYSPFPEEINRRVTTQLSTGHAAPTPGAELHLLREGVDPSRVRVTGNPVIDALYSTLDQHGRAFKDDPFLHRLLALGAAERPLVVATMHRRESWGDPMREIGKALRTIAATSPDALIVVPLHRNPVVREAIMPLIDGIANVVVMEPLPYVSFCRLLASARLALTDSGGVQEEAPALDVPVLVMRETTERPEAVDVGAARLVGTDPEGIVAASLALLESDLLHKEMASAPSPYGDGHAAPRIIEMADNIIGER